ncbi:MAG TPA: SIMPL domain-containing protein [Balneolaceae bacterium]|nr:SIMPL domain-containing protein [Balneolaceae bacterium]
MRTFSLFVTLLAIIGTVQAQTISVNATAEVQVPADKISFQINLNARGETPQKAYNLHKQREKVLVDLLKKYDIKEKDIHFEPISISRVHNNEYTKNGKEMVQTTQSVALTLTDFKTYEKIQIALINNDFDNFSGNFMSSKQQQGENEALKKALKIAHEKASIIAEQIGKKLGNVSHVNFSFNQRPVRFASEMALKSSDSLMQFEQTVTVTASVSVKYGKDTQEQDE